MNDHPIAQRILRDPISLAIIITVPTLLFIYDGTYYNDSSPPYQRIYYGWTFRFLFDSEDSDRTHYNYAALIIIWAVAIIRWKWQKEDKAKQG